MFFSAIVFFIAYTPNALASDHGHSNTTTTKQHTAAHAADGVSAEKAMGWLKNGNTRYLTNRLRKDGRGQSDRNRLAKGQTPHTIIISCADSRVPPETIFDQSLGEVFVVRVAGEALDSSVIASVEYAVEHLGTKNILVMGHTSCGAVKTAAMAKAGESAGSDSLDLLVNDIKPRFGGRTIASNDLDSASVMNARGVANDLAQRSKIIQAAIKEKHVKISSSLYHIDSGKVDFLE